MVSPYRYWMRERRPGVWWASVLLGPVGLVFFWGNPDVQAEGDKPTAAKLWTCSRCNASLGTGKYPPPQCHNCGVQISNSGKGSGGLKNSSAEPVRQAPHHPHGMIWIGGGILAALILIGVVIGAVKSMRR